jgi:RND superfamily putative drug exporter
MTTHPGGLARLARACVLHPWRTIGLWVAIVASLFAASASFGGELVNEFTIPGSETQQAADLLEQRFPARAGDAAQVVFTSPDGLSNSEAKQDVAAAARAAAGVPGVLDVGDMYAGRGGAISRDGTIGFVDVQFAESAMEVDEAAVDQLQDDVRRAMGDSPVQVEFGGPVVSQVQPESRTSEVVGLAAAVIVLLAVLGSAAAMALPLTLALVSVGMGLSLLTLAAALTNFNKITPILAVMIGLGVGIDYALFIVTRFRQALADGAEPRDAAVTAAATAGRAVIFAGATVAISISGLALVGIPFVTKLGIGAAMTVIGAVCTAVTLLPAILGRLGHRIDAGRLPFVARDDSAAGRDSTLVARWGRFVTSHPKAVVVTTLALLLTMAAPVVDGRLGTADSGTDPKSTTTRKAYDLLVEGFGPGFNGPLLVAVDQKTAPGAADRLAATLARTPGVQAVVPPLVNEQGDTAQIPVFLTTSPQSEETSDKLMELREEVVPETLAGTTAHAYVGGQTATYEDIATKIGDRMILFLLFIVGITFLVLTMAFRSIVIATKAALTTMLSGFAAFGALIAVFEWGWGSSLIGLDVTGPTESFIPVIVLSILFGLSMDYEVFLASRIREEYARGAEPREAVRIGVAAIGRVIVAAALIMGVVFWAFVIGDDRTVKAFGLGLGVAILVDALVVRMALVPAVMHLLGKRAWYIPRLLDRALPHLTIEAPEPPADAGGRGDALPKAA